MSLLTTVIRPFSSTNGRSNTVNRKCPRWLVPKTISNPSSVTPTLLFDIPALHTIPNNGGYPACLKFSANFLTELSKNPPENSGGNLNSIYFTSLSFIDFTFNVLPSEEAGIFISPLITFSFSFSSNGLLKL